MDKVYYINLISLLVGSIGIISGIYFILILRKENKKISENVEDDRKLIFISTPYNHHDKKVIEYRVKTTAIYSANLLKSDITSVSPILMGVKMLEYIELPTDAAFWEKYCLDVLSKCDEIHVLMLPEWELSSGIKYEVDYAKSNGIAIKYIAI